MVIETVIISVLSTILVFAGAVIFYEYRKNRNLLAKYVELTMDNLALNDSINQMAADFGNATVNDPDGFIKFLSQSREWAFGYIEEVQQAIVDFSVAMESKDEEKIAQGYIKLMSYLPKEQANN